MSNLHAGRARRLLRAAALLFCAYALGGLAACPRLALEALNAEVAAIGRNADRLRPRIDQDASAIPLECTPEQARAAAAAARAMLQRCVQLNAYLRRLNELAAAAATIGATIDSGTIGTIALGQSVCDTALQRYASCNPADAVLLLAWYRSAEVGTPPLPLYDQEPRGPVPAPPAPATPGYTPPGPG